MCGKRSLHHRSGNVQIWKHYWHELDVNWQNFAVNIMYKLLQTQNWFVVCFVYPYLLPTPSWQTKASLKIRNFFSLVFIVNCKVYLESSSGEFCTLVYSYLFTCICSIIFYYFVFIHLNLIFVSHGLCTSWGIYKPPRARTRICNKLDPHASLVEAQLSELGYCWTPG